MKRVSLLLAGATLMAGASLAECPAPADSSDLTAEILTELLRAPDERTANAQANRLWRIWMTAPDEKAQTLLDTAVERREAYDLAASEALLDDLVAYCPTYAEGFNQRAFTRFLRDDYEGALEDIERVLETHPFHFGALSGQAMTYMRQGRASRAQTALRRAVKVHPFLRERAMLLPEPPPETEGDL